MDAAAAALQNLRAVIHQLPSADLGNMVAELGELAALAEAGIVTVVAEADARGVIEQSQAPNARGWIIDHAWQLRPAAGSIAKAAAVAGRPDMAVIADAVAAADIDPHLAGVIAAEYDKLRPHLRPDAHVPVLDAFLNIGMDHGPAAVRQLHAELLARYGQQGDFQDQQDRCARSVDLTPGKHCDSGVWHYQLTLDEESRAVLEAAIGPLAAPRPGPDGETDPRPAGRRRGEALIDTCRRAVQSGGELPAQPKASLVVSMTLDDLRRQLGFGRVHGTLAGGAILGPDTMRKIACDAGVIPAVLGKDSQVLDYGRAQRLFPPALVRALWLRDEHCTFPGCDTPAAWCDAHHLEHWVDGGATSMENATVLCPRHHTVVHRDHLAADTTPHGVSWNLTPGSYLPRTNREEPDGDDDPP